LSRARRKNELPALFRSISASTSGSAGSLTLFWDAASWIAPMKQADQAAPNRCSAAGCGCGSLMSNWPSLLRAEPLRPAVMWVLPVKRTFSVADFSVVDMAKSFPEVVNRIRLNRVRLIYFTGPDLVKHFRFNRIRFINLRHHKRWRFP
jgi:hypothetical protein